MTDTIRWQSDSCQCILDFERTNSFDEAVPVIKYTKAIQLCTIHKNLKDDTIEKISKTVSDHNKGFSTLAKISDRQTEYKRIKNLGDPIKIDE